MREIRCVSRTTGVQFLSLSLSPQTPSAVLPTAGHIPVLLFVCFTSTRMSSAVDCLFLFVCYPVLVPVPVPVPVPDERRPGNAFPCASTCMYIEADIELSRLHIAWQCTCT